VKLTPRLALVFILYAAVLVFSVGLLAYDGGRDSLRSATISELQATALEKEAALNQWVSEKEGDITSLAMNPATLREASIVLTATTNSAPSRTARDRLVAIPHHLWPAGNSCISICFTRKPVRCLPPRIHPKRENLGKTDPTF
jgi:hypothetical protein